VPVAETETVASAILALIDRHEAAAAAEVVFAKRTPLTRSPVSAAAISPAAPAGDPRELRSCQTATAATAASATTATATAGNSFRRRRARRTGTSGDLLEPLNVSAPKKTGAPDDTPCTRQPLARGQIGIRHAASPEPD